MVRVSLDHSIAKSMVRVSLDHSIAIAGVLCQQNYLIVLDRKYATFGVYKSRVSGWIS
jgi:hypothetical protein